jgi:hypothetical protein
MGQSLVLREQIKSAIKVRSVSFENESRRRARPKHRSQPIILPNGHIAGGGTHRE